MLCENLFLVKNTHVQVSNWKPPMEVVHNSFIQCSTYIGQDGCLRKINFQVKHGKYDSIMAIIIRFYPWWQEDSSHMSWIYPQNLLKIFIHCIYLVVRGSKKQQRRGWDYSNFTKGETFLVSYKTNCYLG